MGNKPVPTLLSQSSRNRPVTNRPAPPKRWTFSFRYWRQIEFFGLDKSESKWFVSVLERLGELSKLEMDRFLADSQSKDAWRYHDIDWTKKNIPIQRADLNWIDTNYLDNPEEYPLVQFMVSQALGRIVGFWDEIDVFNIVLLDPLHNIQPAKSFEYRVDRCSPLSCEYTDLRLEFEKAKAQECSGENCPAYLTLQQSPSMGRHANIALLQMEEQLLSEAYKSIDRGDVASLASLLEYGIMYAMEQRKQG